MVDARRAELWLVDLGEPLGHEQGRQRPAVVVSSDGWNRHAATCTVVPLTRTRHGLPTRVEIEPTADNGLRDTSYARCEDVRAVSRLRLLRRIGVLDLIAQSAVTRTLGRFLETSGA